MKFIPVAGHILIEPEQITEVAKEVKTEGGQVKQIYMGDRSKDIAAKAVNKGRVMASASTLYAIDSILIYYPYCPNKIMMNEKEYHVIHERDVMGYVEPDQVA